MTAILEARPRAWVRRQTATPPARARAGIFLVLVALTGAAWVYLLRAAPGHHHLHSPTMGLGAGLFLAMWVAMTVATMFPAVLPMVVLYVRVTANHRNSGRPAAPTSLFVAGYLLLWSALGALAYGAAVLAERSAARWSWFDTDAARIGGVVIVAAGAFQFSTLKERCLTECRSPLPFLMEHWRDGRAGAVAMGVRHGLSCAGCCWALMLAMFPVGMMNIAVLGALTLGVYAEKVLAQGRLLGRVAGVLLIVYGAAVVVHPALLPGAEHAVMAGM